MSNSYHRKKQPEQIRRALLDNAARIAGEQGLAKVTLEAVARASSVTKGGLLHHFPNKNMLLSALFEDLIEQLDRVVDEKMDKDPVEHGRFTRAYVEISIEDENDKASYLLTPLWALILSESGVTWTKWLERRLDIHKESDSSPMLEVVRLAADGAFFAFSTQSNNSHSSDSISLRGRLIELTYHQ
ncbi:MAG: TetR family transcriptional regulator [Paenibacillus sp.]|nr:TetR family transcriptional regulator [Paenibacillus sp.]